MRRTIKPFTVEIRSSGRHAKPASIWEQPAPRSLADAEQPAIHWPGIDDTTAPAEPEPKATGRVLRSLDEPQSFIRPHRGARKRRAIDELSMGPRVEDLPAVLVEDKADAHGSAVSEPGHEEPAGMPLAVEDPSIDTAPGTATILLRRERTRLSRADLRRGERWKARLPTSVHRAKGQH